MDIVVKDITDGAEVAGNFFSIYLNTFPYPAKEFIDSLLVKDEGVKCNFTKLCLEWLVALADADYDGRNEDSVMYARKIKACIGSIELPRRRLLKKDANKECGFDRADNCRAADFIEKYLRLNENNREFIRSGLNSHKTLQQNFTRMCIKWFKALAEHPKSSKFYIKLAVKADRFHTGLRYV